MRIIVGISGASGVILGYHMLLALKNIPDCETHLVVTEGAIRNFLAKQTFPSKMSINLLTLFMMIKIWPQTISSGSFMTAGMIVIPASMKTVSSMATGYAGNLLVRAADVCIKESRKLVIVPREMPLSVIHLKNLKTLAKAGCTIIPPMLTFYNEATTVELQIQHIIGKVLAQFHLEYQKFVPWAFRSSCREPWPIRQKPLRKP